MDSPDWIRNKKATINPINKKDKKCFQYAVTVALNHEKIGKHPERTTTIKSFINKCKLEGINFPSGKGDCKKFEKNNVAIALNVLYTKKEKNILVIFQNITQVILLMISRGKGWHYFAEKKTTSIIKRNKV